MGGLTEKKKRTVHQTNPKLHTHFKIYFIVKFFHTLMSSLAIRLYISSSSKKDEKVFLYIRLNVTTAFSC
jgi:hypothetical protein